MVLKFVEILMFLPILALTEGSCDNCAQCQGSSVCMACNRGYYLDSGACTQCHVNCDNCNNATSCLQCKVGFWLDTDTGECLACRTRCTSCDSYTVCRVCEDKYYMDNGECFHCPVKCLTCSSVSQCTSCYQGYWGAKGCSETCSSNCKDSICDNFGFCVECPDGVYGKECVYPCHENCLNNKYSKTASCSDGCRSGFYGGSCALSCPENCATNVCSVDGECTAGCKPGFYGSQCDQTCISINCPNNECFQSNGSCTSMCPNTCVTCTPLSSCTSCKPGYFGAECEIPCTGDNCVECNQGDGTCTKCSTGFYLSGTTCVSCAAGCETCNGLDITDCLSCLTGYYLDVNQCKPCNEGCSSCSWSDICNGCNEGYVLSSTNCVRCPPKCNICISDNQCTSCVDGYRGPTCTSSTCAGHRYNHGTSPDAGSCACDEQKCLNKTGETCVSCIDPDWFPSGPGCCPCGEGYYVDNGMCVPCSENCAPQGGVACNTSTGQCDSCEPGFYGIRCTEACSVGCDVDDDNNHRCKKTDGTCNCINGFKGKTCSQALQSVPNEKESNTVVIAAGAGGGVLLLIIIIIVVVCIVRRKSPKESRNHGKTSAAPQRDVTNEHNARMDGDGSEYVDNQMYVPLTEAQAAARGYAPNSSQEDHYNIVDEHISTSEMGNDDHYSTADKPNTSQEVGQDPGAVYSMPNKTSSTIGNLTVKDSDFEGTVHTDDVYAIPNKPPKAGRP